MINSQSIVCQNSHSLACQKSDEKLMYWKKSYYSMSKQVIKNKFFIPGTYMLKPIAPYRSGALNLLSSNQLLITLNYLTWWAQSCFRNLALSLCMSDLKIYWVLWVLNMQPLNFKAFSYPSKLCNLVVDTLVSLTLCIDLKTYWEM